jgi:Zn-dependent M32 family carboxypeptidase
MPAQYDYWTEKKDNIKYSYNRLPYKDYTKELMEVYDRHMEIIDEILEELQHEFSDEQYTETTSWKHEKELEELEKKQEELEPIIKEKIEEDEHQELLEAMGMNQEQYDAYEKEQREEDKKRRLARIHGKRKK